jgi:hypothetical protein
LSERRTSPETPERLSAPTRQFLTRESRALLARVTERTINLQLTEALAQDADAIRALAPGSKRLLLGLLEERLGHGRRPDPRVVVELTDLLLPALAGDVPHLQGCAPAR